MLPPFATCEFPLHEFGKFLSGNERVRVALVKKRREFIAVKLVERN
jgi:hypothetical protein